LLSRVSLQPHGLYSPWNSPGQNTGVGSLSLLQGIVPTQGSNLGLPHCRGNGGGGGRGRAGARRGVDSLLAEPQGKPEE